MNCLDQLVYNYSELSSKPLEPTAKIDQDILNDINEIDKQFKNHYPRFLADSLKPKQAPTSIELVTYLAKMYRESEFMTFSNSHLQNVILRCHRGLLLGLPSYKEKCTLSEVEYSQKKALDEEYVKKNSFLMKSIQKGQIDHFLYILGTVGEGNIYYGKVNIETKKLSYLCEKLYWIQSKMAVSQTKS